MNASGSKNMNMTNQSFSHMSSIISIEQKTDSSRKRNNKNNDSLPKLDKVFSLDVEGNGSNCIFNQQVKGQK